MRIILYYVNVVFRRLLEYWFNEGINIGCRFVVVLFGIFLRGWLGITKGLDFLCLN